MRAIWDWFSGLFDKEPKPSKYTGKVWSGHTRFRVYEAKDGFIPMPPAPSVGFVDHSQWHWVRLFEDGSTSDDAKWEPYEEPSSSEADSAA